MDNISVISYTKNKDLNEKVNVLIARFDEEICNFDVAIKNFHQKIKIVDAILDEQYKYLNSSNGIPLISRPDNVNNAHYPFD